MGHRLILWIGLPSKKVRGSSMLIVFLYIFPKEKIAFSSLHCSAKKHEMYEKCSFLNPFFQFLHCIFGLVLISRKRFAIFENFDREINKVYQCEDESCCFSTLWWCMKWHDSILAIFEQNFQAYLTTWHLISRNFFLTTFLTFLQNVCKVKIKILVVGCVI